MKWKGIDENNNIKYFTCQFLDENDTYCGTTYYELHNDNIKIRSGYLTIIGFIIVTFVFILYKINSYNYYTLDECIEINKLRLREWYIFCEFIGYNKIILNKIYNIYNKKRLHDHELFSYKELYLAYKNELECSNKT